MKKITFVAALFFITGSVLSQDIIVKTSGKQIKSKIVENTNDSVKFSIYNIEEKQICQIRSKIKKYLKRKLDPEKQIFSIPKNEVFMINYENGDNDIYHDDINQNVINNVNNFIDVNNNSEAYKLFNSGQKNFSLGRGLIGAGGGLLAFGTIALLYNGSNGEYNNTNIGASYIYSFAGIGFIAIGLHYYTEGKKKMNTAFDNYRKSLKTSQSNFKMNFGVTHDGLGMNIKF